MSPIDPIRPSSLDDIVDHVESGRASASYGPASEYQPYQWEMPWIETQVSSSQPFDPPPAEPKEPPSFDVLTQEYFDQIVQDLPDPVFERPPLPSYDDCLITQEFFDTAMRNLNS